MGRTIDDLNYMVYLTHDGARVVRIECNFLIDSFVKTIADMFVGTDQSFYQTIEVVYKNNIIMSVNLLDQQSLKRFL
jgi:hypothetical protein